jgi:hypothetical protein
MKGAMMNRDYVPRRDSELVPFTNNFATQLTEKFAQVGRSAGDASAFAALNTAWVAAYTAATAPETRTKGTVAGKDIARRACVAKLRELAGLIQKFSGTNDVLRADFGLPVPKQRSPISVPTSAPTPTVVKRYGTTIVIRLGESTGRFTMPPGVQGARVYTFVGENPPTNADQMRDEGQTTRTDVEISFPGATIGAKVWICAAYYNPRGQLGPGSALISTNIAGGTMDVSQGNLRIAA